MPRNSRLDGLDGLLDQQLAVATRGQLLALGMKDAAMRYRVRRGGPWQTLLPGVYLTLSGVPSVPQKEMAALLYAGPGSLITGPMALLHYGIRGGLGQDVIDVLVPAARQRLSTGFTRLHRTARMPLFNPSLYDGDVFLGKPDAWWPDAGVAAEADSRAWHLSPEDWDRTRRRHDLMAAAGIIPLHFSPRELRCERPMVAQRMRDALARGLARPSLPIRTIPCSSPIQ